jgi:hypothetical protein
MTAGLEAAVGDDNRLAVWRDCSLLVCESQIVL